MISNLMDTTKDGKKASPKLKIGIKNYLIDIDGVICEDIPNEEPERMKTAWEFPGAKDKVNKWYEEGHIISFFTSRTNKDKETTIKWLIGHGFKYHNIIFNKPRGGNYHYFDDKEIESTKVIGGISQI